MRRLRRWLMVLMAPAAILTTVALVAPAASAGTTPVPGPVASAENQVQSQMRHHHGFRPEFFTIKIVNHGNENNAGDVNAFGPVRGMAADTEVSNTQGRWDFSDGSTVNVFHSDTSNVQPQIDLQSCTATVDATGFWAFLGGTGRYSRALGVGQFQLHVFLQFKRHHHHRCRITMNSQPELTVVDVTAFGKARR